MNETTAAVPASTTAPAPATASANPGGSAPPPADPTQPATPARRGVPAAAVPIAILAFVLASAALVLGVTLLHRTDEVVRRLDQAHEDDLLRDQHGTERDARLSALEREWRQAQGDADLSAGGAVLAPADIRRRREQLAMLDIERLLEQVQLQLRLGAAPQAAIEALQAVDSRLARLSGTGAQRVQTALRRDLARLRAAPDIDRGAVVARLDPLLEAVDHWHASSDPLHMSGKPAAASATTGMTVPVMAGTDAAGGAVPGPQAGLQAGLQAGPQPGLQPGTLAGVPGSTQGGAQIRDTARAAANPRSGAQGGPAHATAESESAGARVRAWLAREFGDFMRIREVETPEALLLAPAQRQLLRDRFRLGVLDLRQAILARDERAVRAEAGALDALLAHYFDPNQPEVAAAQAQLRAAAAAAVPAAAVTLDETLAAVHAARAAADGAADTP